MGHECSLVWRQQRRSSVFRTSIGLRQMAHERTTSARGAGAGESFLAPSFRTRIGQHARRLWSARRASDPPRAARLAGERVRGERLETEAAAETDYDIDRLPSICRKSDGGAI